MTKDFENQYTFSRFYEMCRKYPDKIALIYLGEKYTYGALERLVDKLATGLAKLGVGFQDKVMLYISNCPQWIIANFAFNRPLSRDRVV